MRRHGAALLVLVALGGLGVGRAAADTVSGYAGPGEWFSPGEGHGSVYDHICSRWVDNNFAKPLSAWGLVTFIDPAGGWSYSQQGYGNIFRPLPSVNWTKKLHCKNNTTATYQGGCFGYRRQFPCA